MAKKKKTKQQKILADKRRETLTTSLYSFSPEILKAQSKSSPTPARQSTTTAFSSYQYLPADLRKTAVFTALVVLIELVVFYFL